jgi:hypothetical protein
MRADVSPGDRVVRRAEASHALYGHARNLQPCVEALAYPRALAVAESLLNPFMETCACSHELAGSGRACNALISGKRALTTARLLAKRDDLRGEINLDARGHPLNVTT